MVLIKREKIHPSNHVAYIGQFVAADVVGGGSAVEHPRSESSGYTPEVEVRNRVETLEQRAKSIIADAENEARQLKENALQEIEATRQQAEKDGYAKGLQDGSVKIKENIQASLNLIKDGEVQRNSVIKSAEPEILRLAVKIAREIIKKEMEVDQNIIMNILKEAIEKISDNEQVVIKVSHQDLQQVRNNKDTIIDLVEAKNLSIVSDKHIQDGGCMIETKLGYIDARITTKLELIEQAMLAVYEEEKVKKENQEKERQMKENLDKQNSAEQQRKEEEQRQKAGQDNYYSEQDNFYGQNSPDNSAALEQPANSTIDNFDDFKDFENDFSSGIK